MSMSSDSLLVCKFSATGRVHPYILLLFRKRREPNHSKRSGHKSEPENEADESHDEGYISVRVETKALTQKKEIYVADVDDVAALRLRILDEVQLHCTVAAAALSHHADMC